MEHVVRNVSEIASADRLAIEHILGQRLRENQQLIIQVVTVDVRSDPALHFAGSASDPAPLPDWCRVYEGLSDQEVADLEQVVLTRADLSRPL